MSTPNQTQITARPKTVLTFSGGLDSTTLLYYLQAEGHDTLTLSIDYGQRHKVELDYAERILQHLGIQHHKTIDLHCMNDLMQGSSLTQPDIDVPLGHYEEESMKQTVVPNRNMIILSLAAGWAISNQATYIAYAAHAGDHAIYPDCRPEFADACAKAIELADWHIVKLIRPFVDKTKGEIVKIGQELGVPYELTWSCYQGGSIHCGACGTCIERREAFMQAGVPDPTVYADAAPRMTLDDAGNAEIHWQ
ncbi:7-cyano-7-deazaguanine synthase [Poriferisphaera corsica]|uniref:7-cyano-7-deazaguanine synthase n=1 Tax=Poriferisphaera corsica TaxID=2528020 RepID=A0A517YZ03_9BACT|nr:7-cyano-7-deazaguanine synthase QueC [Poriferisphaera corsica]QDU35460.1 7-cyano-7-deazaguanine synthase [Poriferisphaera corsica]